MILDTQNKTKQNSHKETHPIRDITHVTPWNLLDYINRNHNNKICLFNTLKHSYDYWMKIVTVLLQNYANRVRKRLC